MRYNHVHPPFPPASPVPLPSCLLPNVMGASDDPPGPTNDVLVCMVVGSFTGE